MNSGAIGSKDYDAFVRSLPEAAEKWYDAKRDERTVIVTALMYSAEILAKTVPDAHPAGRGSMFYALFDAMSRALKDGGEAFDKHCMHFLADTSFFLRLDRVFKIPGREHWILSDKRFAAFFNAVPGDDRPLKAAVAAVMFELLSTQMQTRVFEIVQREKEGMDFLHVVKGLFSGAVRYDDSVRQIFMRQSDLLEDETLDEARFSNPVYVLGILFIWGFIDDYELSLYERLSERSSMMAFLTDPDDFDCNDFRPEWKVLLKHSRFRGFIDKRSVPTLTF